MPKPLLTPEELFIEATDQENALSADGMRLLLAGLKALRDAPPKLLNENELMSVKSLIAYAAYTQNVSEDKIRTILTAQYGVSDIKALPSWAYQNVIEFLVALELNRIVN